MITTLSSIKNNFLLKVLGYSHNIPEAEDFINHRMKFQEALSDITHKDYCNEPEFIKFLWKVDFNKEFSSKTEDILKVVKLEDNTSLKYSLISEYCDKTSNLVNKTVFLRQPPISIEDVLEVRYCDKFSPYRPVEGDKTKFIDLVNNPKIEVTQELFLKLADTLTISSIHYLNLIIEYTSINGFLSMLTFCPKIIIALTIYQAFYFIKTQLISPGSFYNFLINVKGHYLRIKALATQIRCSFLPNIYFCFGFISTGLLGGAFYLFSIRNAQTGSVLNFIKKVPLLTIHEGIQSKYILPPFLLPIKMFFTETLLPSIYHTTSMGSDIPTAFFLGFCGEKILMIQNFINYNLRTHLNAKDETRNNIKNDKHK